MKFSIIYEAQMVDTSRANEQAVFLQIVEQAKLAEQMGFDCIWCVEHTALTQYAHMSAPETVLAFIAGATSSGQLRASAKVVNRSPAMPLASLARKSADWSGHHHSFGSA